MTDNTNWRELPAGELLDRYIWRRLGGDDTTRYPAYSTDTDAALTLSDGKRSKLDLEQLVLDPAGGWRATIWPASQRVQVEEADTPALAICKAFLAWMDAKEVKE